MSGFAGQYFESGSLDDSGQPKTGFASRSRLDRAGLITLSGRQSPSTGNWVDTTFQYDKSHHLTRVLGPKFERDLHVDALGNVISTHEIPNAGVPFNAQPRWQCRHTDITGRLLAEVRPEGNYQQYVYDNAGRLTAVWRGYSFDTLGDWAADCQPLHAPVRPGETPEQVLRIDYDGSGFPSSITEGGVQRSLVVDGFGRTLDDITLLRPLTTVGRRILPPGYRHLVRGYDELGRVAWRGVFDAAPAGYAEPTALSSSMQSMSELSYDLVNRPTGIKRWRFTTTPLALDSFGPEITQLIYDDSKSLSSVVSSDGVTSTRLRDGAGRIRHETFALGLPSAIDRDYVYSANGDALTVTTSPAPTSTGKYSVSYGFDGLGLISNVTEGGRALLSETHDELGLVLTRATNRERHRFDHDAYGRLRNDLTLIAGAPESGIEYQWDNDDRLVAVIDGARHSTTQSFDGLDRLYQSVTGLGTTTVNYVAGSVRATSVTDPASTSSAFTYDGAGQPIEIDTVDGPGLSKPGFQTSRVFSYTTLGQVATAQIQDADHSATVRFQYDSLGRKQSEANTAQSLSFSRQYAPRTAAGAASVTTQLSGSSGSTLVHSFDELGRLSSISLNAATVAQYQYPAGALGQVTLGNGVTETWSYDNHARAIGIALAKSSALASLNEGLGDDDVPRIRQRQIGAGAAVSDLFKTDSADRVTDENLGVAGVTMPGGNVTNASVTALWSTSNPASSFVLDGAANWLSRSGAGAFTPTIDSVNRYTALDSTPVTYDTAGNTISVSGESYAWDGLGKLKSATVGGSTTQFQYDALGRRMVEINNGQSTNIIWNGDAILALGAQLRVFSDSNATVALASQSGAGALSYVHSGPDHSAFASTDATGALIESYSYSSFGETTTRDPTSAIRPEPLNRFLYQGQLQESFGAAYLMGARDYRPAWGRFLSSDPVGWPGGSNLYAFVDGRPLTSWDPTGLSGTDARFNVYRWSKDFDLTHPAWGQIGPLHRWGVVNATILADSDLSFGERAWAGFWYGVNVPFEIAENLTAGTLMEANRQSSKAVAFDVSLTGHGLSAQRNPFQENAAVNIAMTALVVSAPISTAPPGALLADAQKGATAFNAAFEGTVPIYRGISKTTNGFDPNPAYQPALEGNAIPRGWPNGIDNPLAHVSGQTANSIYTSWTLDWSVANDIATEFGEGIVLRIDVTRSQLGPVFQEFNQSETLVTGPISGAAATRVKGF